MKTKLLGLFICLVLPGISLGQHRNFTNTQSSGVTNSDNVVIIEKQEIQFEDTGIRVIGIAANLLGLDYYYRVNTNYCQQGGYQQPGYSQNSYGQGQGYGQGYGQNNSYAPQPQQSQAPETRRLSNDLLERLLERAIERFVDNITKDCFGTKTEPKQEPKQEIPPTETPKEFPKELPKETPKTEPKTQPSPGTALDTQVSNIFKNSCVGCHGQTNPPKGLSLLNGAVSKLSTYQVEEIVHRVMGGGGLKPEEVMPKDGPNLTDEEVETIRKWARARRVSSRQ